MFTNAWGFAYYEVKVNTTLEKYVIPHVINIHVYNEQWALPKS